jgi:hypothetical protein
MSAKSIVVLTFGELTRGSINSAKRNSDGPSVDYLILIEQRSIVGHVIPLQT